MRKELQYLLEIDGYDDSRSNLLKNSRNFVTATGWSNKINVAVTADAIVSYDNTVGADIMRDTAVSSNHYVDADDAASPSNVAHTFSVWVKAAGRTEFKVESFAGGQTMGLTLNLTTGAVTTFDFGNGSIISALAHPYPNGWWRIQYSFIPETGTSNLIKMRLRLISGGATSYLGDGVSGVYLDRAMLELGSTLGDPIDTEATAGPGIKTFRFCSGVGFTTKRTDTPSGVHFDPRIKTAINFDRNLVGHGRVSGGMRVDAGEIVLLNLDQGLANFRNYGFDGRPLTVRVGEPGAAYPAGYPAFLTGTVEQIEVGAERVVIRLRDRLQTLTLPAQTTLYAGTNAGAPLLGAEGVAGDIKNITKPLLYGRRYLIPATLVNTDKLTYQIHDGSVQSIDAVYDQGVALTPGANYANLAALEAAVPGAATFITCTALGLFRLGSATAGRVLVDAQGDNTGGYINKPGEIINRLLLRFGFVTADIDAASFTAINAAVTGEIGLHIAAGENLSRLEALNKIVNTFGGWLAPTRLGVWQIGRLVAPPGSPTVTFIDADILELDARATNDETRGVPSWRGIFKYKPYFPMTLSDIATVGVTQARRAELLNSWRTVEASDAAIKTKHLLATEFTRETLFNASADASSEATRQLTMLKERRDLAVAVVWLDTTTSILDLGAEVRLTTPRLGYSAGRNFLILGVTLDGYTSKLTLDLWG